MAKVVFKSYNQNDNLLFPPCLGDFIAENDPVRVLNVIVDNLDISGIEDSYAGGGASSYNPRMLVKVVFYAYLQNVYSGRRMEQLLRRDVNFMWLSGMQRPDFNTINLFRKNRLADVVDDIFTQSTIWTPSMSGTEGIAKKWLQTPDMEAKRTMSIWISMR